MSKFGKFTMLVLCLVFALGVTGCGATPTAGDGSTTPAEAKEEVAKPLDLAIGTPADYEDFVVTVTKAGAGPKDYAGKATLAVDVTYQNKGKDAVSYNEFDWQIENSDKARSQESAMVEGKDTLGSGELAPGGKVSGTIYYTPKGTVTKVVYQPSMFSDEENLATWTVK